MTPEEIAWHDRVTAEKAARLADINRQVADNWTERKWLTWIAAAVRRADARAREQAQ